MLGRYLRSSGGQAESAGQNQESCSHIGEAEQPAHEACRQSSCLSQRFAHNKSKAVGRSKITNRTPSVTTDVWVGCAVNPNDNIARAMIRASAAPVMELLADQR